MLQLAFVLGELDSTRIQFNYTLTFAISRARFVPRLHGWVRWLSAVVVGGFLAHYSFRSREVGYISRPGRPSAELSARRAHLDALGALGLAAVQCEPKLGPGFRNLRHVMQRGDRVRALPRPTPCREGLRELAFS